MAMIVIAIQRFWLLIERANTRATLSEIKHLRVVYKTLLAFGRTFIRHQSHSFHLVSIFRPNRDYYAYPQSVPPDSLGSSYERLNCFCNIHFGTPKPLALISHHPQLIGALEKARLSHTQVVPLSLAINNVGHHIVKFTTIDINFRPHRHSRYDARIRNPSISLCTPPLS